MQGAGVPVHPPIHRQRMQNFYVVFARWNPDAQGSHCDSGSDLQHHCGFVLPAQGRQI